MSPGEGKQIRVGDLLGGRRRTNLRHGRGRNGIWPEDPLRAAGSEHENLVGCAFRKQGSARKLCANADDSKLADNASRPTAYRSFGSEPVQSRGVMLMLRYDEGDENVDVEETDHASLLAVGETVHVFDGQRRSAWAAGEYRYAAFETHISLSEPPEQRFDERVNRLTHLLREIREPFLQG